VFARDKEAFSVRDCREMVESVLEAWKREHHERLRESVLHAAPKKLKLYVPADQP